MLSEWFVRAYIYFLAICLILLVGYITFNATMEAAVGESYTDEKWFIAEQYFCAKEGGYEAQQYIGQNCGLFGCVDREKTKCVKGTQEKMIDYNDKIFCQYTMKGDFGWC